MKKIRVVLLVLVAAVLATGTVVERLHPDVHIYTSWWFIALMAAVAVTAIVSIVTDRLWRRPAALMVYASVPLILLGGALTTWTGQQGSITLAPGRPATTVTAESGATFELPFSVALRQFEVVAYPGTHTPMDFVSHVVVEGRDYDISMNNILRYGGYRFYQEDYDADGSSTLSVAHDPWGIPVAYCGFALLLVGLLCAIAGPRGPFRQLLRGAAVLLLLLLPAAASAAPQTLPRSTADRMGRMYVLYKGRVCPLQTYAKDFTTKLTGSATYQGLSAEQVLAGYLFYFDQWSREPLIKVKGGEWQQRYGIAGRRVSYFDLLPLDTLRASPSTDKNLRAAAEKYNLVRGLLSGKSLKLFPVADSTGSIGWYGQNDVLPLAVGDDEYLFVRKQLGYCQEQVMRGDYAELERVFDKTVSYQQKQAAGLLPSAGSVRAERLYNALTTGRWLAMLSITLGLLAFAYALVCLSRGRKMHRAVAAVAAVCVVVLTLFLLLVFVLRWVAGGHVPMAGGFDSMNLMAIAIGIIALCLVRRHGFAAPVALLTMGFCLLVAMMSGSNPPVTNLMPVLNSPLLSLHVAVIMFSYALFFFVMMGGLAGLVLGRNAEASERMRRLNTLMLWPAVFLLAFGIVVGALWANISWGNYWSWDPKEVWALITLLVYALPLGQGVLRRNGAFHLYCLLAFLCVVVTYFGVNFFLGGVHAYN